MIDSLDISSSAVVAQRTRLDVIAGNIANADVTRQADGRIEPYKRRFVEFMTGDGRGGAGVHVSGVQESHTGFKSRYDPDHPDANAEGIVQFPNVSITMEYIDAMEATRAYEANLAMLNVTKGMLRDTIRLFA
ncbi:MAG: flagellar basal body rod protein FlgC [Phycisphaerae bacterium]|nr:flagellar basal body rod protein FlgC [Phycisphaerae bacterium]